MGSALRRCNIVHESIRIVTVRIIMLHRHLDRYIVDHSLTVDNILVESRLAPIQVRHELLNAAFIVKCLFNSAVVRPVVPQHDFKSSGQKCHLPETLFQHIVIKHRIFKNRVVRQEHNLGPAPLRLTFPNDRQFFHNFSTFITLLIYFPLMVDFDLQPVRQRINDRSPNSVKSSGHLVSAASELSSRMENGKHHLHCRKPSLMVDSHRDSPSVIQNRNRIIRIDSHKYRITETRQRFIHRVIHNLIHKVVKSAR